MRTIAWLGIVAALLVCSHGAARAGRTRFGWLYGSEINPERGVELETWIIDENQKGDDKESETALWWGAVVALTEHFELAIPVEAEDAASRVEAGGTRIVRFGGELRWRPQSPDPIEAGPFTNLVRVGVKRMMEARAGVRSELDVVASLELGRVFASVDVGMVHEYVSNGEDDLELRPGGGVSVRVTSDLRLGGEAYGELILKGSDVSWVVVGPTVSLTAGRFWGAATIGVGVLGVRDAGRITFGVAL